MAQREAEAGGGSSTDRETVDRNGNPTLAHPDVHVAHRDDYDSIEEVLAEVEKQESIDALDPANRPGTQHGFRVYCTDLPRLSRDDLEPGMLLYDPAHLDSGVWVVKNAPEERGAQGCYRVDTTRHVSGETGEVDQFVFEQFVSRIVDQFVPVQRTNVQTTLGE